jgi:ribosomal protein S18 acetylase RimI-like enzyme
MPEDAGGSTVGEEPELEDSILQTFDSTTDAALSTSTVAEAVGRDETVVEAHLERLASAGELTRVDLEGQHLGWERPRETFVGHAQQGSYRITDRKTGLVTRANDRTTALQSLADKIELLEDGTHIGAQILGISEAAISPEYFESVEDLLESYVRPDDRHVYVFVESDGVTEIETAAHLTREQTILGFTVTGVFDQEEFSDVMVVSAEQAIEASRLDPDHFPVGVFKATAVHPDHQQEGIGTALASHGLAYLAETSPVLTILWLREDDSTERLADKFGAEQLATFENMNVLGQQCPQCGFESDCSCAFSLYSWGLDGVDGENPAETDA